MNKVKLNLVVLIVCIFLMIASFSKPIEYTTEEMVAYEGFTFWELYNESEYYKTMSYQEALYTFKSDNNLKSYDVKAGQTIIIRKLKEG